MKTPKSLFILLLMMIGHNDSYCQSISPMTLSSGSGGNNHVDQITWSIGTSIFHSNRIIIQPLEPKSDDPQSFPDLPRTKVFPNPFNSSINVQSTISLSEVEISLLDLKGVFIPINQNLIERQQYLIRVDLTEVAIGAYILTLKWESGWYEQFRIIKKMNQ